ncbi:MAG: hypothetical protein PVF87_06500 [Acidimicrobiia bacterium]|jgi:hypothetical protein
MRRTLVLLVAVVLLLGATACGGDSGSEDGPPADQASSDGGDGSGGGDVANTQPPGQAAVSVEGKEYTLELSPAVDCSIADDSITFAFWVGDNSVTLGGGANLYEDGWLGSIDLRVSEPEGEDGPISYFPDQDSLSDGIAIDGDSMSYSGPMMKQPPNDGSNPPPVDVGNGTISATCG